MIAKATALLLEKEKCSGICHSNIMHTALLYQSVSTLACQLEQIIIILILSEACIVALAS